jgi:methyl-accepting chemotaxis protein
MHILCICLSSIPNPKEHLSNFVDKLTQVDEKVSDFLLPQVQEVSSQASRFFQRVKEDKEEAQEWVNDAEEKINLSQKAVEELNNCTKRVKELMDTFQAKTNVQWPKFQSTTDWRSK